MWSLTYFRAGSDFISNTLNSSQAFSVAEKHFGIPIVLDAGDMVENIIPDKLSVITYVSQLYEYFKNRTPGM